MTATTPEPLQYPAGLADQVKGMLGGDRLFALLGNTSIHPDIVPLGLPYLHTVGLHQHGLPEIIVYGGWPQDFVGELVKAVMVAWTTKQEPDRNYIIELPLSASEDLTSAVAFARTVEVSAFNKERYGCVIDHIFPGAEYRMFQLMLPDPNGNLPDSPEYNDNAYQIYLGETTAAPLVGEEVFVDPPITAMVTDEWENLRLHIEENGAAVYHEAAEGGPVAFTVGLSKKNLPEIMIAGKYSKQFIGELMETISQSWLVTPPDISSLKFPLEVENRAGEKIKCEAHLLRVTEVNRGLTTDRVVHGLWPDHVYEVFQVLLPNSDGLLPGYPGYVDLDDTNQVNYSDTGSLADMLKEALQSPKP